MGIREDISAVDSGEPNSLAFARLRRYLLSINGQHDDLYDAVVVYLEEAPVVDWQVAEKYVKYPADPLVAGAAIAAASLRRCPSPAFWSAVEDVATGEDWDLTNDARIQALLALDRSPTGCNDQVKTILRANLENPSAAVRDSAAIAVQRCFGVPEHQIISGRGEGDLITRLPSQVREWIGSQ